MAASVGIQQLVQNITTDTGNIQETQTSISRNKIGRIFYVIHGLLGITLVVMNALGIAGHLSSIVLGSTNISCSAVAIVGFISLAFCFKEDARKDLLILVAAITVLVASFLVINSIGMNGSFSPFTLGMLSYASPLIFIWLTLVFYPIVRFVESKENIDVLEGNIERYQRRIETARQTLQTAVQREVDTATNAFTEAQAAALQGAALAQRAEEAAVHAINQAAAVNQQRTIVGAQQRVNTVLIDRNEIGNAVVAIQVHLQRATDAAARIALVFNRIQGIGQLKPQEYEFVAEKQASINLHVQNLTTARNTIIACRNQAAVSQQHAQAAMQNKINSRQQMLDQIRPKLLFTYIAINKQDDPVVIQTLQEVRALIADFISQFGAEDYVAAISEYHWPVPIAAAQISGEDNECSTAR